MSFERLYYDKYFWGYYSTTKLLNNQTASIFFFRQELTHGLEFRVAFAISNKRRNIRDWIMGGRDVLTGKSTGKGSAEGLVWAKNQLLEFERFICNSGKPEKIIMVVTWTDARRRDIYEYYLGRLGYKTEYRYGNKCLAKRLT